MLRPKRAPEGCEQGLKLTAIPQLRTSKLLPAQQRANQGTDVSVALAVRWEAKLLQQLLRRKISWVISWVAPALMASGNGTRVLNRAFDDAHIATKRTYGVA